MHHKERSLSTNVRLEVVETNEVVDVVVVAAKSAATVPAINTGNVNINIGTPSLPL
jgi:glycerol-3-phosphate cytidylyltransferase-like family protein